MDDWHRAVALDRRNGLLAGSGCPLDFVTFQTYTFYPAEAQAWARKQGVPRPPALYSPLCPGSATAEAKEGQGANVDGRRTNDEEPISPAPLPPGAPALVFTSPDQGSVFRLAPTIPLDKQKIRVSVRPDNGADVREVRLLVNGRQLASGPEALWQMSPGRYTFEAVGLDMAGNQVAANQVTVEVVQ